MNHDISSQVWQTTLDTSGRVLIPAELRHAIGAEAGSTLVWQRDEDGVHLKPYEDVIAEIQKHYKALAPKSDVWSTALINQRKLDASHE